MSLFPAYSNNSGDPEGDSSSTSKGWNAQWLTNSSFIIPERNEPSEKTRKRKKKSKDKPLKNEEETMAVVPVSALQPSDVKKPKTVPASPPMKPKRKLGVKKKKKRKKVVDQDPVEEVKQPAEPVRLTIEEYLKRTEEFNRALGVDPTNVELWLDYSRLQDQGEGTWKGIQEKKLSIIDKGLSHNPSAQELLNERFIISEKILPPDKVIEEARLLVKKSSGNILGWRWIISSTQNNLARMTVPLVLEAISEAMQGVHKAHRAPEYQFELMATTGLFLRQCGLWEQLITLMSLYMDLNLSNPGSRAFRVTVEPPETALRELEDGVIESGLPLGELWLRVEHLRSSVHWYPVENEVEDLQRLVLPEDVASLLYPLSGDQLSSRLPATVLTLLKVPLHPASHTANAWLPFHSIPSYMDSPELLVPVFLSHPAPQVDSSVLEPFLDLLDMPQGFRDKIGSKEFLEFLDKILDKVIEHTSGSIKVCFLIWKMRWWRLVNRISRRPLYSGSKCKKLLKEHRDCLGLYVEYALLERECGHQDVALKVLEGACGVGGGMALASDSTRRDLAILYSTYVETVLLSDPATAKDKLVFAIGKAWTGHDQEWLADELEEVAVNIKRLTAELFTSAVEEANLTVTLDNLLHPPASVAVMTLQAWLLYLTKGLSSVQQTIKDTIQTFKDNTESLEASSFGSRVLECLHELLVSFQIHESSLNPSSDQNQGLFETLKDALVLFPNNLHFQTQVASYQVKNKLWTCDISVESPVWTALQLLVLREKAFNETSESKDTRINQMVVLLKNAVMNEGRWERCALLWRLLLQLEAQKSAPDTKSIFYKAVQSCPWIKSLYYDAAKLLPGELGYIQDILTEKELRMHVSPEELEILRQNDFS